MRATDPVLKNIVATLGVVDDKPPITDEIINILTKKQIRSFDESDGKFLDAKFFVTNNFQRCEYNYLRAVDEGKRRKVPVIIWYNKIYSPKNILNLSKEEQRCLYFSKKELLGIFVQGSSCGMLNEAYNNRLGLVNGLDVTFNKLIFDESDSEHRKAIARLSSSNGFEIINLEHTIPTAISVSISNEEAIANRLPLDSSLSKDFFSFPVSIMKKYSTLQWTNNVTISYKRHAVDYAKAITVYKAEGATLKVGIADFNQLPKKLKPLILPDAFVGISRFREMDDFRICPIIEGDNLNHLKSLKWSRQLILFYKCINPQTGKFDPSLFSWDKEDKDKANKFLEQKQKDKQFLEEYDKNLKDKSYHMANLYNSLTVAKLKLLLQKYSLKCKNLKKESLTDCVKQFVETYRNSMNKNVTATSTTTTASTTSSSRSNIQRNKLPVSEKKTNDSIHSMSLRQSNHILPENLNQFFINENLQEASSILNYLNQEIILQGRNFISFSLMQRNLDMPIFKVSQGLIIPLTPTWNSIQRCRGNVWGCGQLISALVVLLFQKYNLLRNNSLFYQSYVSIFFFRLISFLLYQFKEYYYDNLFTLPFLRRHFASIVSFMISLNHK